MSKINFVTYTQFKTTVKKNHEFDFNVKFEGMTAEKFLALEQALQEYSKKSLVAHEVFQSLKNAINAEINLEKV